MTTTSPTTVQLRKAIEDTLRAELPTILAELLKAHSFRNPVRESSTPNGGVLLTRKQVALRLAQSVQTVARLVATGALPYTRIGRSVLINEADLLAFIASKSEGRGMKQ